jgi:hypothetical protein
MTQNDLIDEIVPDDQQEDEDDLGKHISFKDAVVMSADWTIETINGQVIKGNIALDPGFQRRAAWDETRKSRLIESIIVGMPVPNIVLAENKARKGQFIVIDGKQRLLALHDFIANNFVLRGLDIRTDLNGKNYGALPADDRASFDNSTLRSTVIKNWPNDNFLYTIFYRLNSGSLQLSPQELRKALIGGRLLDAIEAYLETSQSFHAIFGEGLDRRMRDSELVLRFIAFDRAFDKYDGNLKKFLDDTTQFYETNWDSQGADLSDRFNRLNRALDASNQIFGKTAFKKWLGNSYERRVNRAIFDAITRFFAETEIVNRSVAKASEVIAAYKDTCLDNEFKDAIEKTTKSVPAMQTRIRLWGEQLAPVIGMHLDIGSFRLQ